MIKRYHPILVALHWLMARMIILALFFGKFVLGPMGNDDPEKVDALFSHMSIGIVVAALLVLRLALRLASSKPPHAEIGHALLDKAGVAMHWVFYILVAMVVVSGLGTALAGGLLPIVYGASGSPLPESLADLPPRIAHGIFSTILFALLALHVAAALYHQFYLRDGIFGRIWFGHRRG